METTESSNLTVLTAEVLLSADEQTALEQQVRDGLGELDNMLDRAVEKSKELRHQLLKLYESKAHARHATWEEYCRWTFDLDRYASYKWLNHARLERLFSNPSESVAPGNNILNNPSGLTELLTLSAQQAKALWKYDMEIQLEAWRRARRESDNPGPSLLARKAEDALRDRSKKDEPPGTKDRGDSSGEREEPLNFGERVQKDLSAIYDRITNAKDQELLDWWEQYQAPAMEALEEILKAG